MQIPDEQLRTEISEELEWDPRLDTSAVAVSATSGVITLCGTVGSFTEKSAASWDASRVKGVVRVDDRLQIRLLDENRRDEPICAARSGMRCCSTVSCRPASTPRSTRARSR